MKINATLNELKTGVYSCQELIKKSIKAIKKDKLNDFISIFEDDAIAKAKIVDKKIANGEPLSRLEGLPIAIKDNILIKGKKATAGSKMLENYIATYDASVVSDLVSEGAIVLGKNNMDEFAMGSSNETSYFGPVLNPYDRKRVPGGSSGGGAAAVSSSHVVFALGSDTGGSVRQPASFCGVCGFKPSYGRVSRYGLISLASSLDQIGTLTDCVEDCATVFDIISHRDKKDSTSVDAKKINLSVISKDIKNKTFAIPKDFYKLSIDKDVYESFEKVISDLRKAHIKIEEIDMSFSDDALAVYYILQPAEASSNLARYDGLRYGNFGKAKNLEELYIKNRSNGFGEEVKRRILIGTYVLSSGYKDAYYKKALEVQKDIKLRYKKIFSSIDGILLPTSPGKAFELKSITDPLTMYFSDIFTVSANIAGLPAMTIPIVKKPLPIGIQIVGSYLSDEEVLKTAYNIEKIINLG